MRKIVFLGAAMMLVAFLPLTARAAPITWLNDTFTDGGRTNGADALDTAWYFTNGPTVTVGTDLSLTTTSTSTSIFRRLAGEFTAQSLTNVGDSITLSMDFKMTSLGTSGNTNRAFRVGLFNTNSSSLTADSTTTAESTVTNLSNDTGYFVGIGTGTTGTTSLMREDGTGASFMAGSDIAYLTPTGGLSPQIGDLLAHTLIFKITKDSASTVLVDFTLDGGSVDLTAGGGTTTYTTFNEVGFSNGAYQTGFVIDNITVVTDTIPEPATLALLGLGGMAFLRRRK
jgi:hypothetical protein